MRDILRVFSSMIWIGALTSLFSGNPSVARWTFERISAPFNLMDIPPLPSMEYPEHAAIAISLPGVIAVVSFHLCPPGIAPSQDPNFHRSPCVARRVLSDGCQRTCVPDLCGWLDCATSLDCIWICHSNDPFRNMALGRKSQETERGNRLKPMRDPGSV
jgi:hypothetical protein